MSTVRPSDGAGSFAFNGVSDGEYELIARSFDQAGEALAASRQVSVKGGNVEGVRITLAPLGGYRRPNPG